MCQNYKDDIVSDDIRAGIYIDTPSASILSMLYNKNASKTTKSYS